MLSKVLFPAVLAMLAACLSPSAVQCSDGRVCPAGLTCDVDHQLCITEQQGTACAAIADGDACTFSGQIGVCDRGVCIPAACGNGAVGPDEACDDGNTASGDGCRADCAKVEVCGDSALDVSDDGASGEQCDDGNSNPADGCDACKATKWTPSVVLGDDATSKVSLVAPQGIAVDNRGALYIADAGQHRLLRVDGGVFTVIAGTGERGYSGDGGLAVNAMLDAPSAIAVDGVGNLYVASGLRVRRIDSTGTITAFAGTGEIGVPLPAGETEPATAARLGGPPGLAVDGLGNVYLTDPLNHVVRRVSVATGLISTVAGTGTQGNAGEDVLALAGQLDTPVAIAISAAGEMYITCYAAIRHVTPGGQLSTFAGTGTPGASGDGGAATAAAFDEPRGLAVGADGSVYIADINNSRVRRVSPQGIITTFAGNGSAGFGGDGGAPTAAQLRVPIHVAASADGAVFISDAGNRRIRKVAANTITTELGYVDRPDKFGTLVNGLLGVAIDSQGRIHVADATTCRVLRLEPDGTLITVAGTGECRASTDAERAFADVYRIAFDPNGNLIIVESSGHRIRRVSATGDVTTIAGTGVPGLSGDAGPAIDAQLFLPRDVVFDSAGNMYVVELNHRVRKVTPGGTITTFAGTTDGFSGDGIANGASAAQLSLPGALAIDAQGNLYVSDTNNNRVRKVTPGGTITTFAGNGSTAGPIVEGALAVNAPIAAPDAIAFDSQGRLVIASAYKLVYRVALDGTIRTIAGLDQPGTDLDGDGGPAASAVVQPTQIVSTSAGLVFSCNTGYLRMLENSGRVVSLAGPVDPQGAGAIAHARLADPRAIVSMPTMTLIAGGASGTVQSLSTSELRGVIGRYPNVHATGNLARFRERTFPSVGGVEYDASTNRIFLTSGNTIYAVDPVNVADATTWTIAAFANTSGQAGHANGSASNALFDSPTTMYLDAATRQLYVADTGNQVIRKVDLMTNPPAVSTIAGTPRVRGFGGDAGAATSALLDDPQAITRCPNGDFFIADTKSHRVRRVSGTTISTVLGDGTASSSGDGDQSRNFTVDTPHGLACDSVGNVYVTSRVAVRLLAANDAGVVDGSGSVQTIYGRAPRDTFPERQTSCLTAVAVVDATTLRVTDACSGMLLELHRQ